MKVNHDGLFAAYHRGMRSSSAPVGLPIWWVAIELT